jgi:hypothetical protein
LDWLERKKKKCKKRAGTTLKASEIYFDKWLMTSGFAHFCLTQCMEMGNFIPGA